VPQATQVVPLQRAPLAVQNGFAPPPPPSAAPPQQACPTAPHGVPAGPVQEPAPHIPLTPAPVHV
jgi:hypothetical protein